MAKKEVTDSIRKQALKLRLEGMSYPAIGKKLGIEHPWSATMSALNKLDEGEQKKVRAQLDKIGVKRESKPSTPKQPRSPKQLVGNAKKPSAVHAVPKPKDKVAAKSKVKGAPSRIKTHADRAQQSDAERLATIDNNGERSVLNLTRAEREKLVKEGKLPTASLEQLRKLEAKKQAAVPAPSHPAADVAVNAAVDAFDQSPAADA